MICAWAASGVARAKQSLILHLSSNDAEVLAPINQACAERERGHGATGPADWASPTKAPMPSTVTASRRTSRVAGGSRNRPRP